MKKFFTLFLILLLYACSTPPPQKTEVEKPKKYVPAYAKEFAQEMKRKYPERYVGLKFFYDEEENGIAEVLLDSEEKIFYDKKGNVSGIARSNVWKPKQTWGKIGGVIGNGEIEYTLTRKKADEADQRMEQRRKDTTFAEVEKVIFQIATEYKYDYEKAFGIEVQYRNPNTKKAICDDFANAVIESFKNHPLIERVEKWTSTMGNHAWNVIILKDGRKIYCDATWYQKQGTDSEGYVIETVYKTPMDLTFDIEEFNTLGGAIDTNTGEILKVHFAWEDAKLSK